MCSAKKCVNNPKFAAVPGGYMFPHSMPLVCTKRFSIFTEDFALRQSARTLSSRNKSALAAMNTFETDRN